MKKLAIILTSLLMSFNASAGIGCEELAASVGKRFAQTFLNVSAETVSVEFDFSQTPAVANVMAVTDLGKVAEMEMTLGELGDDCTIESISPVDRIIR